MSIAPVDKQKSSNIDIWLVLVIVLLVLSFGGGLWLTGRSILARVDEMDVKLTGRTSDLQSDVFALRKEVQDIRAACAADQPARKPAVAPTPAK